MELELAELKALEFLITVINGAYTTMDFIVTMVDSFNLGKSVISYISKNFYIYQMEFFHL